MPISINPIGIGHPPSTFQTMERSDQSELRQSVIFFTGTEGLAKNPQLVFLSQLNLTMPWRVIAIRLTAMRSVRHQGQDQGHVAEVDHAVAVSIRNDRITGVASMLAESELCGFDLLADHRGLCDTL